MYVVNLHNNLIPFIILLLNQGKRVRGKMR